MFAAWYGQQLDVDLASEKLRKREFLIMGQPSELTGAFSTFFERRDSSREESAESTDGCSIQLRHAEAVIRRMLRNPHKQSDPLCQKVVDAATLLRTALADAESIRIQDVMEVSSCSSRDRRHPAVRIARRVIGRMLRLSQQSAS